MRVVPGRRSINGGLAFVVDDDGRGRCQGKCGRRGGVHSRILCEIGRRYTFERVFWRVLTGEVLARLAKPDGSKAVLVISRVIAAPGEPVRPRKQPNAMRRHVARGPALNIACQLARR